MNREELIEEAANAMSQGFVQAGRVSSFFALAETALAVFEKAQAPTDHVKEEIYGGETVCATCPRNSYGAQVAWEHAHPDEREDMIAWLMRDHGDDLSPLGRDYTDAEIAGMLRRPAQEERHAGSATGV